MAAYKVFIDLGHNVVPLPMQKTIRVHLIFYVKHNGRHKTRLVADKNFTDVSDDSVYSSVVILQSLHMLLFIAAGLNSIELWGKPFD